jgi:hypothetical protein
MMAIGLKHQFEIHISQYSLRVVDSYLLGCDGMSVDDEISLTLLTRPKFSALLLAVRLELNML